MLHFFISQNCRLIAFQHPISKNGQIQLKRVFARRSRRFARKLGDFQRLKKPDQDIVRTLNDIFNVQQLILAVNK